MIEKNQYRGSLFCYDTDRKKCLRVRGCCSYSCVYVSGWHFNGRKTEQWTITDQTDVVSETNRNEWPFFPKSNQNNPVLHTNTHCLNKPAQLAMTHFMFPVVAWLVGLEYFACILHSSCESHTLIESLSTMIHFFRVMTCRVQLNSCQQTRGPSTTPGSQTTLLGLEFFFFNSNSQNAKSLGFAPSYVATLFVL